MWDSNTLVDREAVATLLDRGGLAGIALSHPHFYGAAVDWSQALGGVPIYIHERDQRWMVRPDPSIVFWCGETLALSSDVKLVRCGGHFDGASVLHWRGGAERRGALFTGDTILVGADRASVSFMYSYVNRIPLSAESVRHIVEAVGSLTFDRIYSEPNVVRSDAQKVMARSAERYIAMIEGTYLPSKTL
jgi:glyoxylase-like metal-dependent hydrolase (beta-lactamase superfamily II)